MSDLFKLNQSDFLKGLTMAVLSGVLLPILAMAQTPEFDIASINWPSVLNLAINGAVLGFLSYISKNFLSDKTGRVLGRWG